MLHNITKELNKIIGNTKEHEKIKVDIPFTDFYKIMNENDFTERLSSVKHAKEWYNKNNVPIRIVTRQGHFYNKNYVIKCEYEVEFIGTNYGTTKNVTELEYITIDTYNSENPTRYSWDTTKRSFYY